MEFVNKPDIPQIRSELQSIARLIGPGRSYELLLEETDGLLAMQLPLDVIMRLIPSQFHKFPCAEYSKETMITLCIKNLFEQLDQGMISTTLESLVNDVPDFYLVDISASDLDAALVIPHGLVIEALWA